MQKSSKWTTWITYMEPHFTGVMRMFSLLLTYSNKTKTLPYKKYMSPFIKFFGSTSLETRTRSVDRWSTSQWSKNIENDDEAGSYTKLDFCSCSGHWDGTKEVKINDCSYKLSKLEITNRIEQYGEIKFKLEELAIPGDTDGIPVGRGSYTLKMKLNRLIPNVLPMHILKVKCCYQGVKKQCSSC